MWLVLVANMKLLGNLILRNWDALIIDQDDNCNFIICRRSYRFVCKSKSTTKLLQRVCFASLLSFFALLHHCSIKLIQKKLLNQSMLEQENGFNQSIWKYHLTFTWKLFRHLPHCSINLGYWVIFKHTICCQRSCLLLNFFG